ncbi:MAG: hypothetical protein AAF517_26520, partial [Planctomycetota bacterium]
DLVPNARATRTNRHHEGDRPEIVPVAVQPPESTDMLTARPEVHSVAPVKLPSVLGNGGFELGDVSEPANNGFDLGPMHWIAANTRNAIRASAEVVRTGSFSLEWSPIGWNTRRDGSTEDATTFIAHSAREHVSVGATAVQVIGYVNTENLDPRNGLLCVLANDRFTNVNYEAFVPGGEKGWHEFRASLPVSASDRFVYLSLRVSETDGIGAEGALYIDDLQLFFTGPDGLPLGHGYVAHEKIYSSPEMRTLTNPAELAAEINWNRQVRSGEKFDGLKWDKVQTYGMLPLDPKDAAARGWTVNGLWAGLWMPEAVRSLSHLVSLEDEFPAIWSYTSMSDYVDSCHDEGLLVPATLFGVRAHPLLRKRFPELEKGACVTVDGRKARWGGEDGDSLFMCCNKPQHRRVLDTLAREAIDAKVDLLVFDEVQGNEFCFFWGRQAGFSRNCLARYREHLAEAYSDKEILEKFHIRELETFDFAKRLKDARNVSWSRADPLLRKLWRLQERLNFEAKSQLISDIRSYMKTRKHEIPICVNIPNAGLGDLGGYRLSLLKWAELFDFAAFENSSEHLLPRGKWVASERLVSAAFDLPSSVSIAYGQLSRMERDFIEGKTRRGVYLYALFAEAIANGVSFANFYQRRLAPGAESLWTEVFRAQRFVH